MAISEKLFFAAIDRMGTSAWQAKRKSFAWALQRTLGRLVKPVERVALVEHCQEDRVVSIVSGTL